MNPFQVYVNILGIPIHLMGIILVAISILFGILLQKEYPFHIKLMNSFLIVTLGHYIYEDVFIIVMGMVGRSMGALVLYLIITAAIVYSILMLHRGWPFLSLRCNRIVLIVVFGFFYVFIVQWDTGWFHELQRWYLGLGPDPHGVVWGIGKMFGFIIGLPLIGRREEEENDGPV